MQKVITDSTCDDDQSAEEEYPYHRKFSLNWHLQFPDIVDGQ